MRTQTTAWPAHQLTDGELVRERDELEHQLGDGTTFATSEAKENWIKRLTAIKAEQDERATIRRRSRP